MIEVYKRAGIPAVKFNPAFYKKAYRELREGIWANAIELMTQAQTDSHVAGCLLGRRAGFQKTWSVMPFSDSSEDQKRAEWYTDIISNLDQRQLFKDIHQAQEKKYSVLDFEWEIIDGRQVPVSHRRIEQKYFRYDVKNDGALKIDFGKELRDIPEDALVCETPELPYMFTVLRDFILKEFGLESWASFIETFGEGIIIGKYPYGANAAFKEALDTAVQAIARSGRGTMPDGSTIEITETKRNTGDHEKFVGVADRGISIAILGHENAVQQSSGLQVGENLTQYKVKREIAVDDLFFLDACMQRFIRIIHKQNFSDSKLPKFQTDKKEPLSLKERLELIDLGYNHGIKISPDEYREAGLFIYPDQEPVQKPPSLF